MPIPLEGGLEPDAYKLLYIGILHALLGESQDVGIVVLACHPCFFDGAAERRAHALDPGLALRPFRLALLQARLAAQTGSPEALQAATEHYRVGLQQEPILGVNSANLAALLWQQGQPAEATEMLQRTLIVQNDPLYWASLGYFYEQAGDWQSATQSYGQALALSPVMGASGYWQAAPKRAARSRTIRQLICLAHKL